jgi:acyl-CoA thioester hydrolase
MTWSAPVRYAEIDGQGVVFNAHYLTYCDEAMAHFCRSRGLGAFAADVQLVSSTLNWTSAARWGETIEVDVECLRVGTTSFVLGFSVRAAGRPCCRVETTYVHVAGDGRATPLPEEVRAQLTSGNLR